MTIRRTDIVTALLELLQGLEPLPAVIALEAGEVEDWEDLDGGLQHGASLMAGTFQGTRDAGPVDQWEGVRDLTLAYAVTGSDKAARTARRDRLVPALEAAIFANRTLGLPDPQVWAELGPAQEDDEVPLADATAAAVANVVISVTYVAASAAG